MDNNNKNNWILGIFYCNKEDKRIFPPKRFGLGWTVNFANPISIFAMLLILAAILFFGSYISK